MIKRISHFALHQPLYIVLGLLLFIGAGIAAFRSLPIEAFPDVTDTQVTVITLFPGRAPEEVEKQVTIPLEIALSGVPNSIRMFSHTQFGLSFIVVTFDEKPSLFMARQLVEERLRGLDLPPQRRNTVCAVVGVVAFLDVPLVFMSARIWRSIHPAVFGSKGGGLEPEMRLTVMACVGCFGLLWAALVWLRKRQLDLRDRLDALTQNGLDA